MIPSIAIWRDDLKRTLWSNGSHLLSCFEKERREKEDGGVKGTEFIVRMSARHCPGLTQNDLARKFLGEIDVKRPMRSHLGSEHSFNSAVLSDAVNSNNYPTKVVSINTEVSSFAYGARPVSILQKGPSRCLQTILIPLIMRVEVSQPPTSYLATPQKNLQMMTSTSLAATRYDHLLRF